MGTGPSREKSKAVDAAIREAIGRGVNVAVLWSHEDGEQSELALNNLKRTLEEWEGLAEAQGRRDTVSYNDSALGSHACVAIGDVEGTVCAMLGNFAWLGEGTSDYAETSISCKTTSQGVIGVLAMGLVEMMQGDRRTRDTAEELRLSNIGEKLRGQAVSTKEKRPDTEKEILSECVRHETDSSNAICNVSVVFGPQHYNFGLQDFKSARTSIDVAMGRARWEEVVELCWDLERWAADSVKEVGVGVTTYVQEGVDGRIESLEEEVKTASRVSVGRRRMGGYYLVDSSVVLLSSVNWASGREQEAIGSVSEIGIRMEGEGLVEAFKEKVRDKCL